MCSAKLSKHIEYTKLNATRHSLIRKIKGNKTPWKVKIPHSHCQDIYLTLNNKLSTSKPLLQSEENCTEQLCYVPVLTERCKRETGKSLHHLDANSHSCLYMEKFCDKSQVILR